MRPISPFFGILGFFYGALTYFFKQFCCLFRTMARNVNPEEDDGEVVMVGVVINNFRRQPSRPPTPPICVIAQVWGNHRPGMVGPPAAPPAGHGASSREDFKILLTILECNSYKNFKISKFWCFEFLIFFSLSSFVSGSAF